MEPAVLSRGKAFHRRVQRGWAGVIAGSAVRPEHLIRLLPNASAIHERRGRIDLFVDKTDDFVTVIEIKATDWDNVRPTNRRRLLSSHLRQIDNYLGEYLDGEGVSVCAAVIYPASPVTPHLRDFIESFWNDQGFQVVWYDDA